MKITLSRVFASALAACLLLPGAARAKNVSAHDIPGLIEALKAQGIPVEVDLDNKSDDGTAMPQIILTFEGDKYAMDFSSCRSKTDCDYIELLSVYNDIEPDVAQKIIAKWNQAENFSSVIYVANGKGHIFSLYHYIVTSEDGISEKSLRATLEYLARDSGEMVRIFQSLTKK